MTEITVIKPLEEEQILSEEERKIIFHEIAKELKIPIDYFIEIGRLEDEAVSLEAATIKPEILNLLIRRLIDFGNIIPIVKEMKNTHKTLEGLFDSFGLYSAMKFKKEGGANKSLKKLLQKNKKIAKKPKVLQSAQSITMQLNGSFKSQRFIYLAKLEKYLNGVRPHKYIESASHDEFLDVCGFVINAESLNTSFIDQVMGGINVTAQLRSGNYYDQYLWDLIFCPYKILNNISLPFLSKGLNAHYYLFNESMHDQLNNLFDYLVYCSKYYYNNYQSNYLLLARGDNDWEKVSSLFKQLNQCYEIFREPYVVENNTEEPIVFNIPVLQKFLTDIEKNELYPGHFNYRWNDSIWFDMDAHKVILQKIMIMNNATPEQQKQYKKDIDEFMQQLHKEKAQRDKSGSVKALYREMAYRYLYIKKFGYDKFEDVEKKMFKSNWTVLGNIFDYIKEDERELIEIDFNIYQNIKTEKTPWSRIINALQRARTAKDRDMNFTKLKLYLPKDVELTDDWIRSETGEPIICPHLYTLLKTELKNITQKERETVLRNEILKFSDTTPIYGAFYCKICGEFICYSEEMESSNAFEDGKPVNWHSLDEELKTYIWKQVNQIVRNYVEFKELHTSKYINMFITSITVDLYDFINLIEKKLMKSKTSSLEEIENKKKLFTVIYIYAMLMKIILDNKDDITFVKLSAQTIDKMMKYCINNIIYTQNIVLSRLPEINESFIESSLTKAFKNVVLVIDKTKINTPPEMDLISSLLLDPVYLYIVNMMVIVNAEQNNLVKLVHEYADPMNMYKSLEPRNYSDLITKILQTKYHYEAIQDPIQKSEKISKIIKDFEDIVSKTSTNTDFETFVEGYCFLSFKKFMEYIHSQIYLLPIYVVENSVNVYLTEPFVQFDKSMEILRKGEKYILELIKFYNPRAYYNIKSNQTRMFKPETIIKTNFYMILAREFGYQFNKQNKLAIPNIDKIKAQDKFHKHKWRIYIYVPLNKYIGRDVTIYKPTDLIITDDSDIQKLQDIKYVLIDRLCKICLFPINEIEKFIIDPVKIIQNEQTLINFYNYFESRCPESKNQSVHDFTNSKEGLETCKRCGYTKQMYATMDRTYFQKYLAVFEKSLKKVREKQEHAFPINYNTKTAIEEITIKPDPKIAEWKFNSNIINEIVLKTFDFMQKGSAIRESGVEVFKYKKTEYFNILTNLGLMEKYDFEKILSGLENPSRSFNENVQLQYARIDKLDIYIKEIIFNYTILVNYKNMSHLPIHIKNIIGECNSSELAGIHRLPTINQIYENGNYKVSYFQILRTVRETFADEPLKIAEFLLKYWCELIINILIIFEKNVSKKIAQEIVIFLINNAINMEKTTSMLKESKSAEVEAMHKQDLMDSGVMQDHDQSRSFDGLASGKSNYEMDFDYTDPGLDAGSFNDPF